MTAPADKDAKQMRLVGVVIAAAMIIWIAIQALGREYGWAAKWAYLADLAAIGAFVWSLIVTWRIWRRRNV
ncbi:DUF5337 family protein [Paracoccus sp. (in: a-proteobacteria)]|uniref:DUF5337 family protein n=1 Tax=Paracoccus sp. TaxID=267 RepID=UPI0026E00191|nr:DUF5337 family protein [Paracoccus sp. (in: a-proteobacteria)]MDO5648151.1 DUF5337 family protein [Paracoccus sp. (in: a-proteobacteria)]